MNGRVLVAGLGNVLFGDDGFGVAVVDAMDGRPLPAGVEARSIGVRGLDLAFALMDEFAAAVVVDAVALPRAPGTLVVLDPSVPNAVPANDSHGFDATRILAMVRAQTGKQPTMRIVGCVPARLMDEDEALTTALSPPVREAVPRAVDLVFSILSDLRRPLPAAHCQTEEP